MPVETLSKKIYDIVIGLEVHVQLKTKSKLFCACETDFGAAPNSHVCPVCTAQPGVLPVLNKKVVEGAAKVGLALGCTINAECYFARKQYFYPDLPKAYQISQSDRPICENGHIEISTANGTKTVRVQRIHMEEDAGKLLHAIGSVELPYSLVDLNRSGIPLIEIVSHPDMSSPEEAHEYLTNLKAAVQYMGVSDCDMEKGSLRCDANISVKPAGDPKLGTRVEVKNMNSFRAVKDAIQYEAARQAQAIESGETIRQETRLWNEAQGTTAPMRSKEEAHDYRYFPEPDLVPLKLDAKWIESLKAGLPELPKEKRARFVSMGLTDYDAGVLVSQRALAEFFETSLAALPSRGTATLSSTTASLPEKTRAISAKTLVNWITTELLGRLNADKKTIEASPVSAAALAELVDLMQNGTISGKMAKDVFAEAYEKGGSPRALVEKQGLSQVSSEADLLPLVDQVIAENPKVVEDVKGGKERAIGSLVGALMKKTKGRANPQLANDLLKRRIGVS